MTGVARPGGGVGGGGFRGARGRTLAAPRLVLARRGGGGGAREEGRRRGRWGALCIVRPAARGAPDVTSGLGAAAARDGAGKAWRYNGGGRRRNPFPGAPARGPPGGGAVVRIARCPCERLAMSRCLRGGDGVAGLEARRVRRVFFFLTF